MPPLPGAKPKPRKVPIDVNTGQNASTTDAETWAPSADAIACKAAHDDIDGVGFVFSSEDPYTGIDLDQCRDPQTGAIAAYAMEIVQRLDSYTEISPSHTGLHVFVRAVLPPGGNRKGNVELYDRGRYFTVSTWHLDGTPAEIHDRQAEIDALHAEIFGTEAERAERASRPARPPTDESDQELLDRMLRSSRGSRIQALWNGDTSGNSGDDSGADLALCDHLAHWSGADAARVDRMFRQSALYRPEKWNVRHKGDGSTYGQMTVEKACSGKVPRFTVVRSPAANGAAPTKERPEQRPADVLTMDPDGDPNEEIAVPEFPFDVLPGIARQLVEEATAALVCSADLIAVPLLVFAGAAMGNRGQLALKRDFVVRPNLFAACIAPPGKSKTPALSAAQLGINALQREAREQYNEELRDYEAALQRSAGRRGDDQGDRPARPEMQAFFSTDCTMEAAAAMLTHSPGLVVVRDELVQWVKSFDAYRSGRGGDRQAWLALWSGQAIKIDRKTTGPIYVTDPCLAVVGGVQPDSISDLREEAGRDDGFIDRILWSYPLTPVNRWSDKSIAAETEEGIVTLFRSLRWPKNRARQPVPLSPSAQASFVHWYDANSRQTEAATGLIAGMYSKLPIQLGRLALILHGLALPDGYQVEPLPAAVMDGAIMLVEYFRAHAHKAIAELLSMPAGGANLRTKGRPGPVPLPIEERLRLFMADGEWKMRKLLHTCLGNNCTGEELTAALASLQAERRMSQGTVGRPAEEWRLNPFVSS